MKGQITELVTAVRKIAKLQAKNAVLREVLREVLDLPDYSPTCICVNCRAATEVEIRARALLEGK
jgi:hypothetical protein